jgi:uncharacterized protein YceH (UPF0502 family)
MQGTDGPEVKQRTDAAEVTPGTHVLKVTQRVIHIPRHTSGGVTARVVPLLLLLLLRGAQKQRQRQRTLRQRQRTDAPDVRQAVLLLELSIRQHTSAYVRHLELSIRQHTSAYVRQAVLIQV